MSKVCNHSWKKLCEFVEGGSDFKYMWCKKCGTVEEYFAHCIGAQMRKTKEFIVKVVK